MLLSACADVPSQGAVGEDVSVGERPGRDALAPYDEAEQATGVPASLLVAIALAETGMQMVVGEEEFPGRPRAYGVMGLRTGALEEAAALAGLDPELVQHDLDSNVLAAASWLADRAAVLGLQPASLGEWAPVVADYTGETDAEVRSSYVHDAVYARLHTGAILEGASLGKHDADALFPLPAVVDRVGLDASNAVWRPSPNFNSRSGSNVDFVIIHTCEGVYSGCWGWLVNSASGVSAHYVVNEAGTEISQLVNESDRAWHISAAYDCVNNDNVECNRNGTSMNTVSVGIEHAGYASQSTWNSTLIQKSAELTCGITQRQTVPRDRYHIVAHGKLQPWNRTDPGANWPWTDYLSRVDVACGGGTTPVPGQRVIDSNNASNDTATAEITASANWVSSTNVGGFWSTGYLVAPTEAVSDAAHFRFLNAASTCYDVEAWWTSASDRAPAATYVALNPSGTELGRASVDQRALGSQWNRLGTWRFPAGWNEVLLSRWTAAGAYVVADAVRLTPSSACGGGPAPDGDGDGTPDASDACPSDPAKVVPGVCGCGTADTDGDGDGTKDCDDSCPADPDKVEPGDCGCGAPDVDLNSDGTPDCAATCGNSTVEGGEVCDDGGAIDGDGCTATCQLGDFVLSPITPGTAGVTNTLRVQGATPGGSITWYAARRQGLVSVPGCPTASMPLKGAVVLAVAVVGEDTVATRTGRPPPSLAGTSWRFVAVDAASCRVSDVVTETF